MTFYKLSNTLGLVSIKFMDSISWTNCNWLASEQFAIQRFIPANHLTANFSSFFSTSHGTNIFNKSKSLASTKWESLIKK